MSKKYKECPICEGHEMEEVYVSKKFPYKGHVQEINNYLLHHCKTCDESFVDDKAMKDSEKEIRDFRHKIDGLLTSDEIRAIRTKLGYLQDEFGIFLKVGEKTFNRYENGRVTQTRAMDLFLRIVDACPFLLEEVVAGKPIRPPSDIKETNVIDFSPQPYIYDQGDENMAACGNW